MDEKRLEEMVFFVQRNLGPSCEKGADFQAAIWRLVDIVKMQNEEIEALKRKQHKIQLLRSESK